MKKWLKRIGIGIACLIGLVVALVAAGYIYLNTSAGGERVRGLAVEAANKSLQGRLALGKLTVSGTTFILGGIALEDPEGEIVLTLEELRIKVSLLPLLRKRVTLDELSLAKPSIHWVSDEQGSNLSRALASRQPSTAVQTVDNRPSSLSVDLKHLSLSDGAIDFRQASKDSPRDVQVRELFLEGRVLLALDGKLFDVHLNSAGEVLQPTPGKWSLQLDGREKKQRGEGTLKLEFAGLTIDLEGKMSGLDNIEVALHRLELTPPLARAWLPTYPLKVPLILQGRANKKNQEAQLGLILQAGHGTVKLKAKADLETRVADIFSLNASDVDLRQLVGSAPSSDLALRLEAHGGGKSLDTLTGGISLKVPTSRLGKEMIGPVVLDLQAKAGHFHLNHFLGKFPGLELSAQGHATSHSVDVSGEVNATNLKLATQSLGPKVAGRGEVAFRVSGLLTHPSVSLSGHFDTVQFGDFGANALTLSADVPNVKKPLDTQLSLGAAFIQVAGHRLKSVYLDLTHLGRAFNFQLDTQGTVVASLKAAGTRDSDGQGLLLSSLKLTFPEEEWSLTAPSQVVFRGTRVAIENFSLSSGPQNIRLQMSKRNADIAAQVRLVDLDLSLFPKSLVAPTLRLAGHLNLTLDATGRFPQPDLVASLKLTEGRVGQVEDLSAQLEAVYKKDRAKGQLHLAAKAGQAQLDFDAPIQGFLQKKDVPLTVKFELSRLDLSQALKAAHQNVSAEGAFNGSIEVTGSGKDPRLALRFQGKSLRYQKYPPLDFALTVLSEKVRGALSAQLTANILSRTNTFLLKTPFTLAEIIQHPPTPARLLLAPLDFDADLNEIPLKPLYALGLAPQPVSGTFSLKATGHGTATSPDVHLVALLKGVGMGSLPPTDFNLTVAASKSQLDGALTAFRDDRGLLSVTASIPVPPRQLADPALLSNLPLSVKAEVGPWPLVEFQGISAPLQRSRAIHGMFQLKAEGSGTLNNPRLSLVSRIDKLGVGAHRVGQVSLSFDYAQASSKLKTTLTSTSGGQLQIFGNTKLDLSIPSLKKGLDYRHAPLGVQLTSQNFELGFLSGLSPTVRTLGGTLEAKADVSGTVGLPIIDGNIEWSKGLISLAGFGQYRDIHLQLEGNREQIHLKDFQAASGAGKIKLNGEAVRDSKQYRLSAEGDLNRFPLVVDDQLLASVGLRMNLKGRASADEIRIEPLRIAEARIELPQVKRKNLQGLSVPTDIVLVKNGEPIDGKKSSTSTTAAPPLQVALVVDAPRNLWIKGSDVNAEFGLSDGFKVESQGGETSIFGNVKIQRGRVDVFGRRFDVQRNSEIRFGGDALSPSLDVTAVYKNEPEQVTVYMTIQGQGENIVLEPTSEPPMGESEIYTLLATGRRALKHGSGTTTSGSAQAASIVGSLAAAQLKTALASKLPLDVLSIEAGDEGLVGSKLEAGTYVSEKIYIGYTGRIGADPSKGQNSNAARFEYQFSPRWSFEAELGDAKAGSADLIWSKEY